MLCCIYFAMPSGIGHWFRHIASIRGLSHTYGMGISVSFVIPQLYEWLATNV